MPWVTELDGKISMPLNNFWAIFAVKEISSELAITLLFKSKIYAFKVWLPFLISDMVTWNEPSLPTSHSPTT